MTKDMTAGSPMKLVLSFSIPVIFGNLFQQLYTLVDAIIIGRFLGTGSLAAVGSASPLSLMVLGFCLGICAGFTIPVAQQFGSKDFGELKRYVGNMVSLGAFFSVGVALLTVLLCPLVLGWMSTPADIIHEAYLYVVVIFAGIPITFLFNILTGLLRAVGDSKTPLLFLILATLLNIVFDFLFLMIFPLGVAGAALATVLAQGISAAGALFLIGKKVPLLHVTKEDLKPRMAYLSRLCSLGVPMGLQSAITSVGNVVLQSAINMLGSVAVAAVTAAGRISGFFSCAFDSLGVTMSTYGGQNIGARKPDRIAKGLRAGMLIGSLYAVGALVVIFFFGRNLVSIFIDGGQAEIISQAAEFLFISACFFVPLAAVNIYRLLIQGMGYGKIAIFAGVCEMFARGLTGLFLVPHFGFIAACFASPIAWLLADAFLIPCYHKVMKHVTQFGS